ncbi:Hypothetical protein HVR_LOCUS888 [uncultured virus]|nr:Hypothetical protein HVR_LOCUS888 [uncultured virus]
MFFILNKMSLTELNKSIINDLTAGTRLHDETQLIINDLIEINKLGLITYESQPHTIERKVIYRSYLNGIYPKILVPYLATLLINADPEIIISETILTDNRDNDKLQLYNIRDEDYNMLVYDLYPMSYYYTEDKIWIPLSGYSGNMRYPSRDWYFKDYDDDLMKEIINNMSLIRIWSRNLKSDIFTIIINALEILKSNINYLYYS